MQKSTWKKVVSHIDMILESSRDDETDGLSRENTNGGQLPTHITSLLEGFSKVTYLLWRCQSTSNKI